MTDLLKSIFVYALLPLQYLTSPDSAYFLPTYATAGLIAIFFYMYIRRRRSLSLRAVASLLFPPQLLEHPSTGLDLKLVFFGIYYLVIQVLAMSSATILSVAGSVAALNYWFGASGHVPSSPSWTITLTCMLLVFLAVEFGYWLGHLLLHKIPFLWEFHKVHHSAEVLTPLTEWRQHPVELFVCPSLIALFASWVQGPFVWWFGQGAMVIDPLGANLISMVFWYTLLHLRHTELPFYATGILGKIIQAPAHHQVHHSTNPIHFDTNLGYCLSIFDWMFGTLYVPKKGEKFEFGLGHHDDAMDTIIGSLFTPIGRVLMMAKNALRRA